MGDQHGRAVLLGERAPGRFHRVGQRRERVLHGGAMQAGGLKDRDHFGPTRAIGPGAVYQHDVLRLHGLRGLRVGKADGSRQQARGDEKAAPKCHDRSPLCPGFDLSWVRCPKDGARSGAVTPFHRSVMRREKAPNQTTSSCRPLGRRRNRKTKKRPGAPGRFRNLAVRAYACVRRRPSRRSPRSPGRSAHRS